MQGIDIVCGVLFRNIYFSEGHKGILSNENAQL